MQGTSASAGTIISATIPVLIVIFAAIRLRQPVTGRLHLLRVVPARIAASVQYLQPVFGIAASAALFGDALGVPFRVGVVVILGGLALTSVNDRAERALA